MWFIKGGGNGKSYELLRLAWTMNIRFLLEKDVPAYRDLRLRALEESPTGFGSSYETEAELPMSGFAARLQPYGDPTHGVFGLFLEEEGERLVGMLGFTREWRPKRKHTAGLWSFFVAPEFRGRGYGAALLDRVIEHARDLTCVRQIVLTVTAENTVAARLYASRGFEQFGLERDALCVGGRYYDEAHLMLRLAERE